MDAQKTAVKVLSDRPPNTSVVLGFFSLVVLLPSTDVPSFLCYRYH